MFITFFDDDGDPTESYGPFWGVSFTDGVYVMEREQQEPVALARFDKSYWRVLDELVSDKRFSEFIVTAEKWSR